MRKDQAGKRKQKTGLINTLHVECADLPRRKYSTPDSEMLRSSAMPEPQVESEERGLRQELKTCVVLGLVSKSHGRRETCISLLIDHDFCYWSISSY